MVRHVWSCFSLFVILSLVTGGLYPLAVTLVAQGVFPRQARGSLAEVNGVAVGSELIGQAFTKDEYFWSRPSATAPNEYNAAASTGSNLGPTNPALIEVVGQRAKKLAATGQGPIPIDLVTASGSGLDPHISPAGAYFQVSRVAKARGLSEKDVLALVERHIEDRTMGVLGERRVNVLKLNMALDAAKNVK